MITHEQYLQLLRPINGRRVSKDPRGFSHLESYEVRAHMNRIFGFLNWSEEVTDQQIVFESQHPMDHPEAKLRGKWTVCYRSIVRLTVRCPDGCHEAVFTEGACGDASNQPSRADGHDLALKMSQSQAFKRAAVNLGDQFGASLYNKGSLMPLVGKSLIHPDVPQTTDEEVNTDAPVDAHITAPLAPEVAPETPAREVSSPTPPRTPEADQPPASDPMDELAESDRELAEAEETIRQVMNGDPAPVNPLDAVRDLATFKVGTDPAARMRAIREAMTLATMHGLLEHKTKAGVSVGAWLTAELQRAAAEIAELAKEVAEHGQR